MVGEMAGEVESVMAGEGDEGSGICCGDGVCVIDKISSAGVDGSGEGEE